ncbi:uncharacterized protein LOC124186707 [Neodiprion fabricii]|uniref:uncharacterized protein LOC124186707 n=1 Tax=Neodiprion fabricii TaxID=2872261 RepID=UPI001ED9760F|nr:uncharacterized protein LOC124186707 [Neodiprion fabricii]
MKMRLLQGCMHIFNLRQGTILIAITQLILSGFTMMLMVLALAHAKEIGELVARDTEDALEREAMEEISPKHMNTKRMDVAHHLATEVLYSLYSGLVITVIHFVSSILLLYGSLMNNRHFMAPWITVMMTEIVVGIMSLFLVQQDCPFIAILGGSADIGERLFVLFITIVNFYIWFVVYSTYKTLEGKNKGLTHEVYFFKKQNATTNGSVVGENIKTQNGVSQPIDV